MTLVLCEEKDDNKRRFNQHRPLLWLGGRAVLISCMARSGMTTWLEGDRFGIGSTMQAVVRDRRKTLLPTRTTVRSHFTGRRVDDVKLIYCFGRFLLAPPLFNTGPLVAGGRKRVFLVS